MFRFSRVCVLSAGMVVSSTGVAAGHAQAAAPPAVAAAPMSERPVAEFTPGTNQTIEVGETLTFDGSGSSDPDGGALKYRWRSTGVPKIASRESTYSRTFDSPGRFFVKLTVIDDGGLRSVKRVWVTVTDGVAPVAEFTPGEDQTIEVGETLTFDGSGSSDPDGGVLQYRWRSTGVPKIASRESTYSRTFDSPGRFFVKLTVLDEGGLRSVKRVWVTVTEPEPPIVEPGPPVVEVETDGSAFIRGDSIDFIIDEPFTLDASKSVDPDGGPLSFEWRLIRSESDTSVVISTEAKFTDSIENSDLGGPDGTPDRLVLTVTDDEGEQTTFEKAVGLIFVD